MYQSKLGNTWFVVLCFWQVLAFCNGLLLLQKSVGTSMSFQNEVRNYNSLGKWQYQALFFSLCLSPGLKLRYGAQIPWFSKQDRTLLGFIGKQFPTVSTCGEVRFSEVAFIHEEIKPLKQRCRHAWDVFMHVSQTSVSALLKNIFKSQHGPFSFLNHLLWAQTIEKISFFLPLLSFLSLQIFLLLLDSSDSQSPRKWNTRSFMSHLLKQNFSLFFLISSI